MPFVKDSTDAVKDAVKDAADAVQDYADAATEFLRDSVNLYVVAADVCVSLS